MITVSHEQEKKPIQTSVSETIQKPLLAKAQTALGKQKIHSIAQIL